MKKKKRYLLGISSKEYFLPSTGCICADCIPGGKLYKQYADRFTDEEKSKLTLQDIQERIIRLEEKCNDIVKYINENGG